MFCSYFASSFNNLQVQQNFSPQGNPGLEGLKGLKGHQGKHVGFISLFNSRSVFIRQVLMTDSLLQGEPGSRGPQGQKGLRGPTVRKLLILKFS